VGILHCTAVAVLVRLCAMAVSCPRRRLVRSASPSPPLAPCRPHWCLVRLRACAWFSSFLVWRPLPPQSRYKLKFSPDKVDTMIVQAIGLLDDLDKEINTYAMRVKEWYGWHFPEVRVWAVCLFACAW
jgi:hypothetical protein